MRKTKTVLFVAPAEELFSFRRLLPIEYRRECWVVLRPGYGLLVTDLPLRQSKLVQDSLNGFSAYLARLSKWGWGEADA